SLEAADECSHQGDTRKKVKSIEIIDREVIGPIKEALDRQGFDYKMMILPDHYTPVSVKTHTSEPVPFLIYDSSRKAYNKSERFNEFSAKKTGLYFKEGYKLADYFFGIST
ncbi:unnamed protein product, partial [marine sediment metagenome]